ncbi:hypothetical protein NG895_28950 [Aeoliella sp. ICT_H6.2]|uniref:Uncharacterized protein n=1 Tax=Aeoliella straminimaris TaxID=2954799 RepID=A0A9X2JJJ2_9BACT|nr:hypothetical protein [Aeoliella straminimaris]MCO6047951.1 hypothetical protein [Aeoliella straminimaris]
MKSIAKNPHRSQQNGPPAPPPRQAVLVLAHADGWLEAFAERNIDVLIVMVPTTGTVAGEVVAEEFLDQTLPLRYRDLHWPIKRRAADKLRIVRPSDLVRRQHDLALLQGLDAVEQRFTPSKPRRAKVWTL